MSRQITDEECEAADLERDQRRRCGHYNCHPVTWSFETGAVLTMQCDDCGDTKYLEDRS